MSGVWLIILFVAGLLLAIDVAFVSWAYALDDRPARIDIPTADGWTVVAWHRPAAQRRSDVPVVLCHGLANNHAFMEFRGAQNLARALAEEGFDCYSVDLRGAGASRPPDEGPWDATIDDHVRFDLPAIVDEVCRRTGARQVAWVGHSLGGVVALAAASTSLEGRLAALVTVGSPVFFRFPPALRHLVRLACWLAPWGQFDSTIVRLIAPMAGRAPPPKLTAATANLRNLEPLAQRYLVANVFAPMWRGVLRQLGDWMATDTFRSVDGSVDYRAGIARLEAPTLVIGGTVDQLAPPDVTRDYFELLRAPERELVLFGKTFGHSAEYGHGDLVVGREAHVEVYPVIRRFLARHLTSAAAARSGS
ncbi:MAG: alpha/beta fold hydrolase [Myxococcota bacterium]